MIQQKKIKTPGNGDERAYLKTGRNDDDMFGIPRANLELKHVYIMLIGS